MLCSQDRNQDLHAYFIDSNQTLCQSFPPLSTIYGWKIRLALSDTRGRALRIEWTRPLASEVAAVARRLWEATV
jgi:hypothetical protein